MDAGDASLPQPFAGWFASRGWRPRAHQSDLVRRARAGQSTLLIAPTGAGKTLAGFLPSLIELAPLAEQGPQRPHRLHTLYVSPLKALTTDVARNLETPVREMGLSVRLETRTGDTPAHKRQRQRAHPPDMLLTTPEQLCLLVASEHARVFFEDLQAVIIDEIHAIAPTKRGDLLALALARLRRWAPVHRRIGLSATVADEAALARWLVGPEPSPPLRGRGQVALVFVNTRSQAEWVFQELWRANDKLLPIALHHGSLDVSQRRRVEAAMAAGQLKAVVATSTLDLGIDWGDVDLVISVGAPKGASRLAQRIGRANHRMDEPSRALLVPAQSLRSTGMPRRHRRRGRERARHAAAAHRQPRRAGAACARLCLRRTVRLVAGRRLGQIEEWFIEGLTPGDTFIFAGEMLRLVGVQETDALVVRASGVLEPKIPSYAGGKFPLSTFLAERVREMLHEPKRQRKLPEQVREWIKLQKRRSIVPAPDEMLVETFPRGARHYLVCYPFEGRLAHQTLGMLLTRRLERVGKHPLGFLASEYAMAVWGLERDGRSRSRGAVR
jgi:Lhr-like helicase